MLDPITTVETPMRLMCFASWMISDAVCDAEIFLADVILSNLEIPCLTLVQSSLQHEDQSVSMNGLVFRLRHAV